MTISLNFVRGQEAELIMSAKVSRPLVEILLYGSPVSGTKNTILDHEKL